jgi:hypothetical protein
VAHAPPWQVAGEVQAMHGFPPVPHLRLVPVVRHWVPSQQPLQVRGPQLLLVHWPCRQLWVIEQAAQLPPSRPQATGLLPG